MRERALETKLTQDARIREEFDKFVQSYVVDGKTYYDLKDEIDTFLDAKGITPRNSYHVQTILHMETFTALNFGRYKSFMENKDLVPLLEFDYITDSRHREGTICHEVWQKGGLILPVDDEFWQWGHPPCHMNCRSVAVGIPKIVIEQDGIEPSDWKPSRESVPKGFEKKPWTKAGVMKKSKKKK